MPLARRIRRFDVVHATHVHRCAGSLRFQGMPRPLTPLRALTRTCSHVWHACLLSCKCERFALRLPQLSVPHAQARLFGSRPGFAVCVLVGGCTTSSTLTFRCHLVSFSVLSSLRGSSLIACASTHRSVALRVRESSSHHAIASSTHTTRYSRRLFHAMCVFGPCVADV